MRALLLVAVMGCVGGRGHDDAPNVAFVTSTKLASSSIGSLAHADEICNAAGAALGGTYVAWLSTSQESAASRLAGARGWVLPDGRPLADTVADLMANGPWYPLQLDEHGMRVPPETVATGEHSDALPSDWVTCNDLAAGANATIAIGQTDLARNRWRYVATEFCDEEHALYCFGVDRDHAVAPPAVGPKIAFLSREAFTPAQGVEVADHLCATEATAQGYPGTFRALLATSQMPARARFGAGPWARVDGVRFSEDLSAIDAPLDVFIDGEIAHENTGVWTGAGAFTQPGTETCADWSYQAGARGVVADAKSTAPGSGGRDCGQGLLLYCLEQ